MAPFVRRGRSSSAVAVLLAALATVRCGGGGDGGPTPPPVVDNTPASIVVAPAASQTIVSGASLTLTAAVAARDGRALPAATVTWSSADTRVATVSGGVITGVLAGATSITATAGTASASVAVTVTPGPASALAMRTEPVGATIGSALGTQPVVEIRDAAGNLATTSTVTVTAAIASGGGTLGGTTIALGVNGVATFSNLSVAGSAGARTLGFTATGLTSVTSASITMTPPPTPVIVLDSTSVTFVAFTGSSPSPKTVTVTNGGSVPFTAVTIDAPAYGANQPTGWLTATLSGSAAPFTIALTAATATLPVGSYQATVGVNAPGATNTPATLTVNLTLTLRPTVTYGTATERIRVLDVGQSYSPAVSILLGTDPQPVASGTFRSRATSVVTVDGSGRTTAVGSGQSWVAASFLGASDSVFVQVTRTATGPVMRADRATYDARVGDTLLVTFTLDPRGVPVGAASVAIGYEFQNSMFSLVSAIVPAQTPLPVSFPSSEGVYRVSVASAIGLTTPVAMLQLKLVARLSGRSGFLTFTSLDVVGIDGVSVDAQVTSTRYPVIVR